MKHIYLFSGIGADERVFQYLDFSGYQTTFITWLPNENKESIENYTKRLADQIKTNNPIFVGLSFGGIVAIEMAKFIKTEKIILIASVKTFDELPLAYRRFSSLQLHKLLPNWILVRSNFMINWLFGTESKSDRKLLADILHDTDPVFVKWAIGKISSWKNTVLHKDLIHIHGTADKLFPFRFVKCDLPVEGGGHFMTVNKSTQLTNLIRQALTTK